MDPLGVGDAVPGPLATSLADVRAFNRCPRVMLLRWTNQHRFPSGRSPTPLADVLSVHGSWEHFRQISLDPNFNALTPIESEETDPSKCITAALCFAGAIGL